MENTALYTQLNHIFYSILFLTIVTQISCAQLKDDTIEKDTKRKLSHLIFDTNNKPTELLKQILNEARVNHTGTYESILAATQKYWLRPVGKERWEEQKNVNVPSAYLSSLFASIYLTQEVIPSITHYDYAVLLGADVETIRHRLAHLITLSNEGISFNSIVVLSGARPLDKNIESKEIVLHNNCATLPSKQNWCLNHRFPTTETEMIKLVFDQTNLPASWDKIPIIFVDTPLQKTENNLLRRPNTQDTIKQWLNEYSPQYGSVLAISNPPYTGYQDALLRQVVPEKFSIETVSKNYQNNTDNKTTSILLDTLARWIYVECQIIQAH